MNFDLNFLSEKTDLGYQNEVLSFFNIFSAYHDSLLIFPHSYLIFFLHKMKTSKIKISFVAAVMLLLQSCGLFNKDEIKPASNEYKISLGNFTQVVSTAVPATGGVVTATMGELKGMTISVPKNAYPGSRQFTISTTDASNSNFGQYLKPLTSIIKIENGGGYANGIMEIKVPVKIPEGHFPMAFYIDEMNNQLEAVPINVFDGESVTVTTRHFSTSTIAAGTGKIANLRQKAATPYSNLIISSMAESIINNSNIIASGFKPGTDDWEFINQGSYMAPGGHCAGQNMAAMWYYFEKKPSEGNLFNKFNTVDKIQYENNGGYRFCSVIHSDLEWDGTVVKIFDKIIDKNQNFDKYKWYAIAGAMLATGEPQGVGIYISEGTWPDGTPKYGGHDLICYQVDVKSGKLYISDPNTPGKGQAISMQNDKFNPYVASYKGGGQGVPFPFVTYYAKTAYIDWEKIGKRWSEVVSKKIGDVAPNKFPEYTIWNNDDKLTQVTDSISVSKDTLRLVALSEQTENWYSNKLQGKKVIGLYIFDENGNQLLKQDATHKKFIRLKTGVTKLGVYIYAWRNNDINDELYIDFKWIKVNYEKGASFTYWLKGKEKDASVVHFGAKNDDGEDRTFGGSWSGNTFKVDKKMSYEGALYFVKMTAVANANKTVINSFNIEMWLEGGGEKWVLTSVDGKNLPLFSSTSDYLTFGAEGTATCQYFTRVNFEFWGTITEWSCDETSFVKFKIPKP